MKRKKSGTKRTDKHVRSHAINRGHKRVKYFNENLIDFIENEISSGNPQKRNNITFHDKQSKTRTVWKFMWKDQHYYAVYSKDMNQVCTFLTQEMIDGAHDGN